MKVNNIEFSGLTIEEVETSRNMNGRNEIDLKKNHRLLTILKGLIKEPMVLLLLVTAILYYITGNTGDSLFLSAAIILVAAISIYQEQRSENALSLLQDLSLPNCNVIRAGDVQNIKLGEVVVGDSLMVEEGTIIAADGHIIHSNDFSVNESILTGESIAVNKDKNPPLNKVFRGTMVTSGLAIAVVDKIGINTEWGRISQSLDAIEKEKTPLEIQINSFVKRMVLFGSVVFMLVWILNYLRSEEIIESLLQALTLAMSILPEEIPVAFATFMALGAWRLMDQGIIVKQMKTVEALGGATILCIDKTGTITKNEMSLTKVYSLKAEVICNTEDPLHGDETELIDTAMWASEPIPFDPMEVALHNAYKRISDRDRRNNYQMIHEYPLNGKPPMMTHIFQSDDGHRIIAAKGAPEALMAVANLSKDEKAKINHAINELALDGYRLLGVGLSHFEGTVFPEKQQDLVFEFLGLVAFYDPPKAGIHETLNGFYEAGIELKIITGDNAETTQTIAKEIGFRGADKAISGNSVMKITDGDLPYVAKQNNVFTRMFPQAKLRVINALKSDGAVVGMVGDGINDAPALKSAHIGIAMGKKGTEIAKDAATLILSEDDLSKMLNAVAMGRKIYTNLKKAIQYIISIHIPIILTVFIPLVLNWVYPNIFSPVHVILLELIMGPTCSIIYENEPMEANTMKSPPRPFSTTFFKGKEIAISIVQGLVITLGVLFSYQYAINSGLSEGQTRAMVFTTLIAANIFLTLVNRSFYFSIITTLRYRNVLVPIIIGITLIILSGLLFVQPLIVFFEFESLPINLIGFCFAVGFLSVIWYELIKWRKRINSPGINRDSAPLPSAN